MLLVHFMVICVLSGLANGAWYHDLFSPKGLHIGDMVIRLEDSKVENRTFEDRIAVRVDYGDIGVSALHSKEDDDVELRFFMDEEMEGKIFL